MKETYQRLLFLALADWWHEATDALSSPTKKMAHPAYQRIMQMGQDALPYILLDLQERGGFWYYALEQIAGMSPLPKNQPVRFADLKQAWIEWGSGVASYKGAEDEHQGADANVRWV